jgi:hypothetical protein
MQYRGAPRQSYSHPAAAARISVRLPPDDE